MTAVVFAAEPVAPCKKIATLPWLSGTVSTTFSGGVQSTRHSLRWVDLAELSVKSDAADSAVSQRNDGGRKSLVAVVPLGRDTSEGRRTALSSQR